MSRNASGTYSLPAGNPVVSGTTITIAWANATLNDLATEMTDSLDRSGKGAMLAALQIVDGTVAAPGVAFASDLDNGFYRVGANDYRASAGGVYVQKWLATGVTFPLAVTFDTGFVVDWTETTLTSTTHSWQFQTFNSGLEAYDGQSTFQFDDDANSALKLTNVDGSPLQVVPSVLPATGAVGALYVTVAGVLKICTVAGSPGTWVSVGAQV